MPDRLQIIYDAASEDYDMGTFDEFKSKMLIPEKRRVVFDAVSKKYELGDFETFEQKITPTSRIDDFLEERRARQEVSPVVREDKNILRQQVDDLIRVNPEQYKSIRSMQKAKEPFDIMQSVVAQVASTKVKPPEERPEKEKKEPIKPMPISPYGMLPVGEREFDVSGIPEAAGKGLLSGLTQTAGTVGTAMQYTGGKIGIDFLEKAGQQTHEFWEREGEKYVAPEELQGSIIDNPKLLSKGAWYVYNIAQMMPSFAAAFVPAIGTAKYINILGKTMKWSAPTMMRLARLAPSIVGGAAGGVIEGTSTYQEILKRGGTKDEAEAGMELMTLAAGALNAISFSFMTKKMPKGLEKSLLSYLERGGTEAFTEWAEEPSEGMIKMSLGHATWEDVIEQSKQGVNVMFPAFIMGVGGTAISSRMEAIRTGKQPIITEEDIKLRDDVVKAYNEFVEVSGEPESRKITSFEDIGADIYKKMLREPPTEAVKIPEPTPTLPETEKVQPAKPVKAVEEVKPVPTDKEGIELVDLDDKPITTGEDGMVTLYHRTSQEKAKLINETGKFISEENQDETFFSTKSKGQAEGYGDAIITVKVKPSDVGIDDAFHGGEIHVTVSNRNLSKVNIIPSAKPKEVKPAEKPTVKQPTPEQVIEAQAAHKKLKDSIAAGKRWATRIKGKTLLKPDQVTEAMLAVGSLGKFGGETEFFNDVLIHGELSKKGKWISPFKLTPLIEEGVDKAYQEDVVDKYNHWASENHRPIAANVNELMEIARQELGEVTSGKKFKTVEQIEQEDLERAQTGGFTFAEAEEMQKHVSIEDMEEYDKWRADALKEGDYAEKDITRTERVAEEDIKGEILRTEGEEEFDEETFQETLKFFADKAKAPAKPTSTEITKKVPADATTAPFDMPDSKTGDIIKQGEPIYRLDDGKIVSEKTYKDLTTLGKQEELLEKKPEKPAIQKIYHFTKSENINKILSEGFDTTLSPIHGTKGLGPGAGTGKKGKDVLYFTTDTERWKSAVVYVGEGKGDISREAYDYQNQKWTDESNAYKKINLSPIEAEIKAQAKILKIDSYESGTKAVGRIDKFEFVAQLLKHAKENNYDIVHLSDPGGTAWHRPDGRTTKYGDDSWYQVLSGSSGKNDFFVLNKEAIKVTTKLAKTEKPSVEEEVISVKEADRQTTMMAELEEKTDLFKGKAELSPQIAQILLSLPPEMKAYPYGKQNIELRQKILEELTGQKVPKSKAGAGVVRAALAKASNATGEGMQDVERGVIEWIKDISEGITKPVEKPPEAPETLQETTLNMGIPLVMPESVQKKLNIVKKLFKEPEGVAKRSWNIVLDYLGKKEGLKFKYSEKWNRTLGIKVPTGKKTLLGKKKFKDKYTAENLEDAMFYRQKTGNIWKGEVDTFADVSKRMPQDLKNFIDGEVAEHINNWRKLWNASPFTNDINAREEVIKTYLTGIYAGNIKKGYEYLTGLKGKQFVVKNFMLNKKFYLTLSEAFRKAGLVPRFRSITDQLNYQDAHMIRLLANNELLGRINELEKEVGFKLKLTSKSKFYSEARGMKDENGQNLYMEFDDPFLRSYIAGTKPSGKPIWATTEAPALVYRELGEAIQGVFNKDAFKPENIFWRTYDSASATIRYIRVTASGFHLIPLGESFAGAEGLNVLNVPRWIKKGKELLNNPEFVTEAKEALLVLKAPSDVSRNRIEDSVRATVNVLEVQGVAKKVLGKVIKLGTAPQFALTRFIFDQYMPILKIKTYYNYKMNALKDAEKKGITYTPEEMKELSREIASVVNNQFGGQVWAAMRVLNDPKVMKGLYRSFGYVDWSVSALKQAGGAFQSGLKGRIARRYWARYGLWFLTMQNVFSYLFTGLYNDEDDEDKIKWSWDKAHSTFENEDPALRHKLDFQLPDIEIDLPLIGKWNPGRQKKKDGTWGRRYYSHFGKQMLEIPRYGITPLQQMFAKGNPVLQIVFKQWFGGTPFKGGIFPARGGFTITGEYESWKGKKGLERYRERAIQIFQDVTPFSIQSMLSTGPATAGLLPISKATSLYASREYIEKAIRAKDGDALLNIEQSLLDSGYKDSSIKRTITTIKNNIARETGEPTGRPKKLRKLPKLKRLQRR